ncbi:MAG TPA: radical SAM protein [Candidatus Hydrogenedentes bacterium]|jgi:hypothetical protein|nr:radical SAM protein [Candidatus Hydrogenedentota bacterium]
MKSHSILVRFPGYPFSFSALMPDHELASVAGCLMAEGHKTVIRDFGTVGLVDRLFPEEERTAAQEMSERFLEGVPLNALRTLHMLWQLRSIDRAFQSRQTACCEELARKLAETPGIDFIALKINHQDDLPSAILLAKRIRHHAANRCLAAFGRIADFYGRQLVNTTTAFDCVCVGDPELGITALADHIHHRESWPTLPNLILPGTDRPCHTQREYVQDLNALPDPVYDAEIYRALRNNRKLKLFPIEESRGCDQSCNHCPKPGEEGGLRLRSPLRVTAHMRRIAASHGVGSFHLIGGGAPAAHAADVAHAFHESGIRTAYSRESSLLAAETAHLPLLKRSGCVSISYGIGSGSQRLLRDYFNLDTGVTRIENLLRGCREAGLVTVARFMYPTPADDHHTGAETLRLLERTRPDAGLIELPEVLPRTAWYQQPWRFGFGLSFGTRLDKLLRARSRFGAPPGRWSVLPCRIGTLTSTQVLQCHESMIHEVELMGVTAYMLHETPLVAHVLGWQHTLMEFRNEVMRRFLAGDVHGIARMVHDFNECASADVSVAQGADLRAAVGN